jgi:histone H1/5
MSYKAGIVEAIGSLKDRNGSSMMAIKKVMIEKLAKDKKWMNATFLAALKSGVKSGELVQIKNSYKLSADYKKQLTKKTTKSAVEEAPKKKPVKKAAPAKAEPKKKATAPKKKATTAKKPKAATEKKAPKKKTETTKKVRVVLLAELPHFLFVLFS